MSQHVKMALKGELTRFLITIQCAIGCALSNVRSVYSALYVCKYNRKADRI